MRYYEIVREDIQLRTTCRDSYKGVLDMAVHAYDGNDLVAFIDYGVSQDKSSVFIKMIRVGAAYQRRKLATAMLKHLQAEYPETEIDWGMLTDDGEALKKTVPFRAVPNEEVRAKIEQLATAKAELARYQEIADSWEGKPIPEDQHDFWAKMSDRWNLAHDQVRDLEYDLYDAKPDRHIMDFGS